MWFWRSSRGVKLVKLEPGKCKGEAVFVEGHPWAAAVRNPARPGRQPGGDRRRNRGSEFPVRLGGNKAQFHLPAEGGGSFAKACHGE